MRKAKTASPGCRRFESTKRPEAESFRASHLKTTRKRGFFMSKREFLLSVRPEQATFVACVRTVSAERCFCLRTIKGTAVRKAKTASPGCRRFESTKRPEAESFRASHLKTTRKRGFFMSKREFLLLRALSKQPDPAGRHACVGTVSAERCFCLRTIKRYRCA